MFIQSSYSKFSIHYNVTIIVTKRIRNNEKNIHISSKMENLLSEFYFKYLIVKISILILDKF